MSLAVRITRLERQGDRLWTPQTMTEPRLDVYRDDPAAYIRERLGWEPWSGTEVLPGQQQVIDAYVRALKQQQERDAYEAGTLGKSDLTVWRLGDPIVNWIRVEAGHTVGKTKVAAGLVNHFFDCFPPAIVYTFAPTFKQIHDLLWKEIKTDRRGKGLPGRILDLELRVSDNHFANGVAASNAEGKGTERVQGQHGPFLMFVLDEAEGIADFVFDAVNSMASGGVVIVLLLANPRTRASRFYRVRELSKVVNLRISCLGHPNVRQAREVIPGAVRRDYVEGMIEEHCERVAEHSEDEHTFEVPWRSGEVFKPDPEFLFRVLGIAPANIADDTFLPVGRYEAACKRDPVPDRPQKAWMGIDAAGYGNDLGTIYVRHNGAVWRAATCSKPAGDQDPTDYWHKAKKAALALRAEGVTSLHIRIDAGGGFGNGVYDLLKRDLELYKAFTEYRFNMVHFGGICSDARSYADMVTQMYAEAAETVKGIAILKPPANLEAELCERRYQWMNKKGIAVKKLAPKEEFRKQTGRSPDDGDGFVLCVAHSMQPPEEIVYSPTWGKATRRS